MHYAIFTSLFLHGSKALATPSVVPDACTSISELTAEDFYFYGSYLSPLPGAKIWKGSAVSFRLVNPILDYKANCSVKSNLASKLIHYCDYLRAGHSASFTFNRNSYKLYVNQTWNCPSEGRPVEVKASVYIPLSCVNKDFDHDFFRWRVDPNDYATGTVECEKDTFRIPIARVDV